MSGPDEPVDLGKHGPPPDPGSSQPGYPPAGSGYPPPPGYPPPGSYPQPGYGQQPGSYPPPGYGQQPYGYPVPYSGQVIVTTAPGNGIGVAGFVLGLLGLLFCWVPFFGLILGVLGVIFSGAGMSSAKRNGSSTGLAVAGLILGIISLLPAIIVIAALNSV